MRLELTLRGARIVFTPPTDGGPFPWLTNVGTLRIAASAGYDSSLGTGESPSLRVSLDNTGRQLVRIIGQPLRELAEVYADDGSLFFSGLVSAMDCGPTVDLEIGT